ncbi:THO complex subunit 5 homolog isoform X2 [Acanthaster planci]|uniref:THO complex subunit 5 homolog isoform X2 n=1 Tax=Acanthaster planci TaxID=133434 RepID=A0A8B7XZE0_ACAPL|nr:THO complex subunit 5 homolog isoform X2 [Acanthaster planci]
MSGAAISVKKKRRLGSKPEVESSQTSPPKDSKKLKRAQEPTAVQESAGVSMYSEEQEVLKRDGQQDLELHRSECAKLRQIMEEIQSAKQSGAEDKDEYIASRRMQASLHFITLKKLNRVAHLRCKAVRETTMGGKQRVDSLHLQLQNLLYEVMHLQKEIKKCREFKSKDEDIELVDVETFYREAPSEISAPHATKKDPHKQRLARLDWELEQRKRLAEKLKDCQSNTDILAREINTKEEYLDSLQPQLATILQATIPVQEYLSMPIHEIRAQHQTAKLLPRPLYILYVQASAYQEARDSSMSLKIEGDKDAVISAGSASPVIEEESDSDNEESLTQSKRRRKTIGNKLEEKRQKLLAKHPLQVVMTLKFKDGSVLTLTFSYLTSLHIVTVGVDLKLSPVAKTPAVASDLLSPDQLLSCLYYGDTGQVSPNSSNAYQFSKLGMDSMSSYISETGHPYRWAQWLAGLDFLPEDREETKAMTAVSTSHMESTLKALRSRTRARLALTKQLTSLEHNTVPVPAQSVGLFPAKIAARLTSWVKITKEDFQALPFLKGSPTLDLAEDYQHFYLATCSRGSAILKAAVLLSVDYPRCPPHILVGVTLTGEHNDSNDNDIRDLESELNLHYDELVTEKSHDYLLSSQLQRLLMCFDVYVETRREGEGDGAEGPTEFAREKMFIRLTRGRGRSKPYKYNAQYRYFTQR